MHRTRFRHESFVMALTALSGAMAASSCGGSGLKGTYSDPGGAVLLDIRSGGEASLTMMGEVAPCTYDSNGDKLSLSCKGDKDKLVFTIHDDGSLTGPPGTFIPALRKKK